MRPTVFQRAELRDENDNIIQQGTYGKGSALSNSTNDGWIDYVMNNLEWLYDEAENPSGVVTLTGDQTISDVKTFTSSPVAPTPLVNDDSTNVATTEFVKNVVEDYLPLSGGTMTGEIGGNMASFRLKNEKSDYSGNTMLMGGNASNNGAYFQAHGKASNGGAGFFNIVAVDGTNTKTLQGRPDGTLTWDGQPLLPVGIVQAFAGNTIPNGWLLCDGSAVSRTDYAALYAVIGDTYGAGDGSVTFNLPNLTDKFIQGNAVAGTEHSAGLPNITGNITYRDNAMIGTNGVFLYQETGTSNSFIEITGTSNLRNASFDASRSSAIYGNSTTVQPPAVTMRYIIKY